MQKPKVGLLGLTLEFYEQLAPQLRSDRENFVRQRLIPALADSAEVHFDHAVFTREDVERVVTGFETDGVDIILVVLLTYSPSLIAVNALKRTNLPIVIWNTQELYAIDESFGEAEIMANHGVHGTHDLCNVLVRTQVPFRYLTGHMDDPKTLAELTDHFTVAHAIACLRRARIGLLGYPFPGMGDFGLDTTYLAATLGCTWQPISISEYIQHAAGADAAEVKKLITDYRKAYKVASDVTEEDLAAAARAEITLRRLVKDHRLDAFSYQFLSFGQDERTETLPFVAACRLMADGIGFGGEGDLISAIHSALLGWLQPPAGFCEMFTIDFAGNAVLLCHMGEANVAMAPAGRVRLVRQAQPIVPIRGNQLSLVCTIQPGPATLTALTLTYEQRWRIIASEVTVEDFGPLDQLAAPHTKIKPAFGDVKDFLTAYGNAGGPHHMAICFGDARDKLAMTAQYLGAEYLEF
ncbi:MAG: hypothetical protein JSV03_17090 [Planctomycetota bacterium]|nr:MAG: hypothetical protein JSV03_17090 [Planctomycetota bacterium]